MAKVKTITTEQARKLCQDENLDFGTIALGGSVVLKSGEKLMYLSNLGSYCLFPFK